MSKILIVDDDPDIVESMKVVLENKGYKVLSASSGKEGLGRTRRDKPNLIILDIMMETWDKGVDVCAELKRDKNYKHIPILMLTGIKEMTDFDFKKELGDKIWLPVDDYCEKPLKPKELIAKVETLLKKK